MSCQPDSAAIFLKPAIMGWYCAFVPYLTRAASRPSQRRPSCAPLSKPLKIESGSHWAISGFASSAVSAERTNRSEVTSPGRASETCLRCSAPESLLAALLVSASWCPLLDDLGVG